MARSSRASASGEVSKRSACVSGSGGTTCACGAVNGLAHGIVIEATHQFADQLHLTAQELLKLGAVERVVEEKDFSAEFYEGLKADIAAFFAKKKGISGEELIAARYARFRKF